VSVPRSKCKYVIAVTGQPNVGKSTLFNVLTGKVERVGNFPGTTVAMSIGIRVHKGESICFVDLPGIYGLKATSLDEKIARDFIIWGDWDAIVVLVDVTTGISGFYLLAQILQLTKRVVIALTKWDAVKEQGLEVDLEKLERVFGVPVVPVSALKSEGIERLVDTVLTMGRAPEVIHEGLYIDYGPLEPLVAKLTEVLKSKAEVRHGVALRGIATLIAMGDMDLAKLLNINMEQVCSTEFMRVKEIIGSELEDYIANSIRLFLEKSIGDAVRFREKPGKAIAIPKVFQNPVTGSPLSFAILFVAVFTAFAINTGFPFTTLLELLGQGEVASALESYTISGLIGIAFDNLKSLIHSVLGYSNPMLASFLADGVVEGVGVVTSFIPLILITLAIMSAIEDSGLGPLMAVSLHSFFAKFGLSGRAAYPMFISLGCNVPGVMASRAALDDVERFGIIASSSFIPCQARLIVMLVFIGYLLAGHPLLQAVAVIGLYLGGILLYLITAKLFRRAVFRVKSPPELLLEIPRLKAPSIRVVWWDSWALTKHFIIRAGTVLVALVAIVWSLTKLGPRGFVADPAQSFAAMIGTVIGNAIAPLYNLSSEASWKIGFALLSGFIAKENLIATLAILTGVAEESGSALKLLGITLPQGLALLVFFMYYIPCLATVATIYSETRSLKLTLLIVAYVICVALALSLAIYRIALLFPMTQASQSFKP